ncbi:2'-5'-oligoadenylate synthase 1-like isoform X2 [Octodon degus]|uniref:2'-5' oligoadenylate synthase n=1 Tax=Octodon degus TaxID=10160 RepID=A0A6P6EWE9_OCTDE|nr:2'-5'-oligoadenylate synthase 1-like isoform X2 [Octodon degus]
MDLISTPARGLDKFIESNLLPDTAFRTEVKRAISMICEFLKRRCFEGAYHRVRVSKAVKGGSSGKGTTLRGRSDADLVVFLTNLSSFQDQITHRGEFISEIRKQLEKYQTLNSNEKLRVAFKSAGNWANPRVLSFELSSPCFPGRTVEFDVLPAFDALGQVIRSYRPDPEIYVRLINECTSQETEGEFSTCFTELQKDFVKRRPTKVKSLIRLVKHWYQLCKKKLGGPLPPQYALELLTIYAWENGSGETLFNTAQGFKTVLLLVMEYQQLCIYWTEYYNFENATIRSYLNKQLRKPRPVILDPADPTGNLGGSDPERWRQLAQEAKAWLGYTCFKNWDGSSVSSWNLATLDRKADITWNPGPGFYQCTSPQQAQEGWSCVIL